MFGFEQNISHGKGVSELETCMDYFICFAPPGRTCDSFNFLFPAKTLALGFLISKAPLLAQIYFGLIEEHYFIGLG